MRIKKITANNLAEGKQLVKEKLGEDAVILSTRTVKDEKNNSESLEIVAAIDNKKEQVKELSKSSNDFDLNNNSNVVNRKLDSITSQLTYPLLEFLENNSQQIYKSLLDLGYDDKFSLKIIKELSKSIDGEIQLNEALNLIASKINHSNLLEKKLSQKIYSFVGPAGSGKTSTLLKFASIHKIIHSSTILIINLNNYNFGDKEILKTQAKTIGIDYKSVNNIDELNVSIKKSKGYDIVLIDCDGEIKTLPSQVENILVIPTTLSKDFTKSCIENYNHNYIALTFTDKILTIQNIINLILEVGTSLVFYSNGGNIPDDFEVFDQSVLMKFLVKNVG